MKFLVNETFQFRGAVRRAGTILIISPDDVKAEAALGYHEAKKKRGIERHLSGLITHCTPADEETAKAVSKALGKEVEPVEEEERDEEEDIAAIRAEMDEMGAAYDRRWKLDRLKNELVKAKKMRG